MNAVSRNIFSLALSRITSGVILFVVQARLADYLGPDGFGKYSLVIAFYVIFSLFVDFGMSRYVIKKVSADKSQAARFYGNFLVAQLFLAAVIFGLFLLVPRIAGYEPGIARSMLYAGAGLFFAAMSIPALTLLHAWQKIHIFAAVIFLESLAKAAWFALAIVTDRDLVFVFQIYFYVGVFDILVYALLTRKLVRPVLLFDRSLIKSMLAFGLPFAMISGFEMLVAKIDTVIQKAFLPYSEVGLYAAAYRFLDFLTFLPAIVAISLFPVLAETENLRDEKIAVLLDRINRYLITLALPLGVGVSLLADKIILPLFGFEYSGSVLQFRILIWSTVVTLVYAAPNVIMQVKMTKQAVLILVGATVINVIGNLIFIPRFGIVASSWLTVLSYILVAGLYIFYSHRLVNFQLWRFAPWPAMASVVMGAALWPLRTLNIFFLTGMAILIYFSILFAVGFLSKKDLEFIRGIRA